MRRSVLTGALLVTGWVGCVASPRRAAEPITLERAVVHVELRAEVERAGERRGVRLGEALRTGDRIALFLRVDRPSHVVVVQFSSDRGAAVLFPVSGLDVAVAPGDEVRVPAAGQWFELDEVPGEESVFVVASPHLLAEVDAELDRVVAAVRANVPPEPPPGADEGAPSDTTAAIDGGAVPRAAHRSTPHRPARTRTTQQELLLSEETRTVRGLRPVAEGGGSLVYGRSSERGVAVVRFWFRHAAR